MGQRWNCDWAWVQSSTGEKSKYKVTNIYVLITFLSLNKKHPVLRSPVMNEWCIGMGMFSNTIRGRILNDDFT